MTVFLLWENHAAGPVDRFGPHAFLIACVADRLGVDRFELRRSERIRGRSCNGNGGVLRDLAPDRPLWNAAPHLVAVLDSDKLHKLLGGEARKLVADADYDAWAAQMEATCRKRLGPHEIARLTIHFLDRNLETLLEVLGDTSHEKDIVERDKLLQRAAADPALLRRALDKMPSWAHLVDTITRLVRDA
jgi:hypothetical protein